MTVNTYYNYLIHYKTFFFTFPLIIFKFILSDTLYIILGYIKAENL